MIETCGNYCIFHVLHSRITPEKAESLAPQQYWSDSCWGGYAEPGASLAADYELAPRASCLSLAG